MTIAELDRLIASRKRVKKIEAQEKASYHYILGDLIGRSIARIYSSSAQYPAISEVYTTLFDSKELEQKKQEQKAELSALRFKQFANAFNSKLRGCKVKNE